MPPVAAAWPDQPRRRQSRLRRPAPPPRQWHRRTAHPVRPAQPAAQRLPALLHDRPARPHPDHRAAPAQGTDAPGHERRRAASCAAASTSSRATCPTSASRRASTSASSTRTSSTPERFRSAEPSQSRDPRYQAVLARLPARGRFGIRLGLGRTRALLKRLGDPQLGLRGVLIGGTNGKGSTQAMVGVGPARGRHPVGQTPKPHLVSYRERIVVDGR